MENSENSSIRKKHAGAPEDTPFLLLPAGKKTKLLLRDLVFVLLAALLFAGLSLVLDLKGKENENYSAVATYGGFYGEEKNSMDVLFLGSSNAYCAFSPAELEKRTGLVSWNLASSQQSLFTSYYWLREALWYQKPKAVVLDAYYLYFTLGNEGSVHKAFDFMRPSAVKRQAVSHLVRMKPDTYNKQDLYFPLLRYHERWKEITPAEAFGEDSFASLLGKTENRGYCPRDEVIGDSPYAPLEADGSVRYTSLETDDGKPYEMMQTGQITALSKYYFEKIAALCEENGITLFLVKTPISWWSEPMHDSAQNLAAANNVPFLDLNERSAIEAMGYVYQEDAADHLHANTAGAKKITNYLATILKSAIE